LFLVELYQALF